MKLLIEISKEKYEWIKMHNLNIDNDSIVGAVANGIPYVERPQGDLISRDALKISFKEHCCGECDCCVHQKEGFSCELIDNAPTVELTEEQAIDKLYETGWIIRHDKEMTERPQGEWLPLKPLLVDSYHSRITFRCDQCRYIEAYRAKYCAGCGAYMRGENNEESNSNQN